MPKEKLDSRERLVEILEKFRLIEWTMTNDSKDTDDKIKERANHFADAILKEFVRREDGITKAEAVLDAIRKTDVGSEIIIHNSNGLVWCILKVVCKEHEEDKTDDGGKVVKED